MKLSSIICAALATFCTQPTPAAASPAAGLDTRQSTLPDANCCCCDLSRPGYVCKVPDPETGCEPCNKALCPFNPETERQCCCCDPQASPLDVKCKAIPSAAPCACPAIGCPFNFDISFLPI